MNPEVLRCLQNGKKENYIPHGFLSCCYWRDGSSSSNLKKKSGNVSKISSLFYIFTFGLYTGSVSNLLEGPKLFIFLDCTCLQ